MKSWFFNLSVKGKIILIIAINLSFVIVSGVTTVFIKVNTTAALNEKINAAANLQSLLQKTDMIHHALHADVYKILAVDSGDVVAYKKEIDVLKKHKDGLKNAFEKISACEVEQGVKDQLEVLRVSLQDYAKISEEIANETANARIDFKSEYGIKRLDDYNALFDLLSLDITKLTNQVKDKGFKLQGLIEDSILSLALVLAIVMLIAITTAVYLSLRIAKYIAKPIIVSGEILAQLSSGEITDTAEVEGNDETAQMLQSLNSMVTNLHNIKEFVTEVGNGNFNTEVSVFDNKGDIYESLNKMKNDLKNTAEEDMKRNWATEGMAKFGEILRLNNDDITVLSNNIIRNLVKYLNANQGGLFIVNDSNTSQKHLELIACYAWNKKKYLNMHIQMGEGLVGQAWQENDTIYITEVPKNFIRITSGLGDANPSCFLIVPLTINDVTFGVLEIASFNEFEKYQIEFVKKIAESIASTLSTAKINERTKILLEQSQQQAEEMRAQEEEMRQNMEEMHATQEEMQRKETEMFAMIEKLKKSNGE